MRNFARHLGSTVSRGETQVGRIVHGSHPRESGCAYGTPDHRIKDVGSRERTSLPQTTSKFIAQIKTRD